MRNMKKYVALLVILLTLLTCSAIAEESYVWEPTDEMWECGNYYTVQINDSAACNVFVFDNWELADMASLGENILAQWNTGDGRALACEIASATDLGLDSMESLIAMIENSGGITESFILNDTPVCTAITEDRLTQRSVATLLPDGNLFCLSVFELADDSQIEEADNMLCSLRLLSTEISDLGISSEDLDLAAGRYIPISFDSVPLYALYLYNDFYWLEYEDAWAQNYLVACCKNDDGQTINFHVYSKDLLDVHELSDLLGTLTESGYEASLARMNGVETISYYSAEDKHIRGIAVMAGDNVLIIAITPITDEIEDSEAIQMLWSICPAQ